MTTKTKTKTKTKRIQHKKRIKSPYQPTNTPASLIIDAHYAKLGIKERWTEERVEKLCAFLRITLGELGSLIGVPHGWWKEQVRSTKKLSGPICILLTIIERHYMAGYTDDVITNLFNFNGKQEDT